MKLPSFPLRGEGRHCANLYHLYYDDRTFFRLTTQAVLTIAGWAAYWEAGVLLRGCEDGVVIFLGMDDTDTLQSRGTGHLARTVAAELAGDYVIAGVTRHQLLEDDRVPCTARNSCAAILISDGPEDLAALFARVRASMLADFQPGSDPGLCIADGVPPAVQAYARQVQRQLMTQADARALALSSGILLEGLGGDEDGVIGALAAVGLAATGEDGRYVQVGSIRSLEGVQPVEAVIAAGATCVETTEGETVTSGLILCEKLRPARRRHTAVVVVERDGDVWRPLKLN